MPKPIDGRECYDIRISEFTIVPNFPVEGGRFRQGFAVKIKLLDVNGEDLIEVVERKMEITNQPVTDSQLLNFIAARLPTWRTEWKVRYTGGEQP